MSDFIPRFTMPALDFLGQSLGGVLYTFWNSRRNIVERNIHLCFQDLTLSEQRELTRNCFLNFGVSFVETIAIWVGLKSCKNIPSEVRGLENLEGGGVLLLGAHFMSIEVCTALLAEHVPISVVHKPFHSTMFEQLASRGRSRFYERLIPNSRMFSVVKSLKRKEIVWYAIDQHCGARSGVPVLFFSRPVMTVNTIQRIVDITKCKLVLFSHYKDGGTYKLFLRQIPQATIELDQSTFLRELHRMLEEDIRRQPAQYFWLHRRFKHTDEYLLG